MEEAGDEPQRRHAGPGMEGKLTRGDLEFASRLALLIGGELAHAEPLAEGALLICLSDGRKVVAKGVARQSQETWRPGRPWAELVALDALGACGAPVPKLLAADLEHGWLAVEYAAGERFEEALLRPSPGAFAPLVRGLAELEEAFGREWECLASWAALQAAPVDELRGLAARLGRLIDKERRGAWAGLAAEALDPDDARPGPLDVQPANVIWGERVTFVDMASFGYDWTERRLAAYAQRPGPKPESLLDEKAYAHYAREKGERASVRLAFFDLLYWGLALTRLLAAVRAPESAAAERVRAAWGDPERLIGPFVSMWERKRLNDPRVEQVRTGLILQRGGGGTTRN